MTAHAPRGATSGEASNLMAIGAWGSCPRGYDAGPMANGTIAPHSSTTEPQGSSGNDARLERAQ